MTRAAAFFDLDKTLLAKSSTLAYAKPLYESGMLTRKDVMRSAYGQFMYLVAGANETQMDQMRAYMSDLVKGWDVETVKGVVSEALESVISPIVYEEALKLFDEHHAAGRDVIVISSSGTEVIEPICEKLGADRAIGTQIEIKDGKYTGEMLFYAYGEGKAEAIRDLAEDEGYDLSECYAYSDSITDLPMLEEVGHPFPTNPDKELRALAAERVWPVLDFKTPVALRTSRKKQQNVAVAGAAAAASTVALGIAWYSKIRSRGSA